MQNILIFYAKYSHFLCKIFSFFMQNCLIFYAKLSHFLCKIVSFFMQNCLIFYAKLSHFLRKIVSFFTQNCLIFYANTCIFLGKTWQNFQVYIPPLTWGVGGILYEQHLSYIKEKYIQVIEIYFLKTSTNIFLYHLSQKSLIYFIANHAWI